MVRTSAVALVAAMISHAPAHAYEALCFPSERLNRSAIGPKEVDKATAAEILVWLNARTPPPAWTNVPVLVKDVPDAGATYVVVIPAKEAACAFRFEGSERAEILRIIGL